jgi:hypothetical protein
MSMLHEQYVRSVVAERSRPPKHQPPPRPPRPGVWKVAREQVAFVLAVTARRVDEPTSRRVMHARQAR